MLIALRSLFTSARAFHIRLSYRNSYSVAIFCIIFDISLNLNLNSGACAGFALANGDWLRRTIAFYQVFFQQGRVALGK